MTKSMELVDLVSDINTTRMIVAGALGAAVGVVARCLDKRGIYTNTGRAKWGLSLIASAKTINLEEGSFVSDAGETASCLVSARLGFEFGYELVNYYRSKQQKNNRFRNNYNKR